MIVYHVCSSAKFKKYIKSGGILPPVRAWETIDHAHRFSVSTGRRIILRLKFPNNAEKLAGHYGAARVLYNKCEIKSI